MAARDSGAFPGGPAGPPATDASPEARLRAQAAALLRVARLLLRDEQAARAACLEALLEAPKANADAEPPEAARDRLIRACRARLAPAPGARPIAALLPRFLDDGHHVLAPLDWSAAAEQAGCETPGRAGVRDCVDGLPPEHRILLLLRDGLGLSAAETARALEIGEAQVKESLHLARQALRTLLAERFHGSPA